MLTAWTGFSYIKKVFHEEYKVPAASVKTKDPVIFVLLQGPYHRSKGLHKEGRFAFP